jgi:hypothetical protein
MTIMQILALAAAASLIVGAPLALGWIARDYLRGRGSERRRGSAAPGIGAAMTELDRLLARPSAEHVADAERPIMKRDDDRGDL